MLAEKENLYKRNVLQNTRTISFLKSPAAGQPLNEKNQFQVVDITMTLQVDILHERFA